MVSRCSLFLFAPLLLCVFAWMDAQALTNLELEMLQAKDFVEAGDGPAAREIYGRLSAQEEKVWKKRLLAYDIATTYLMAGQWLEALHHYDAIRLGDPPFPLLTYRLKTNMAIAHWRLAEEQMKAIKSQTTYFEEEYFNIFFLLKKALKDIDIAEKAHCELMHLEGEADCLPSSSLEKLRLAVEQRRAQLFDEYSQDKIALLSIKEALPLMISGLTSFNEALNDLEGVAMSAQVKEEQIRRIVLQTSSWIPLWVNVNGKIEVELDEEKRENFKKADDAFLRAIQELNAGALDFSASLVQKAQKLLNDLFFLLLEEDPMQEIFQKILSEYDRALASTEIQEEVLKNLMGQQKTIEELFVRRDLSTEKLEEARKTLETASQYVYSGKGGLARIYLLLSYQQMERMSWGFEANQGFSAEQVLEHVISEQNFSTMLNNLMLDSLEHQEGAVLKLVREAQTETLKVASLFWSSVLKAQKQAYEVESSEDRKKNALRCQFQPWSLVMPLFEKGYEEASEAMGLLMQSALSRPSRDHQQLALQRWKEALDALKNTPPQESCESPPGGGGAQKEKQPENPKEGKADQTETPQPQKASMQEVLRLLQQMDQDDRQQTSQQSTTEFMEKGW